VEFFRRKELSLETDCQSSLRRKTEKNTSLRMSLTQTLKEMMSHKWYWMMMLFCSSDLSCKKRNSLNERDLKVLLSEELEKTRQRRSRQKLD
jgi:hypothetical protein